MKRRAVLTTSTAFVLARLARAGVPKDSREWTASPLHTFSHCSVYDHSRGGAVCYIRTAEGEREWYVSSSEDEFSYQPEILVSPDERFAAMVQKAGSTHIGINVFSVTPRTFKLTNLFSPYLQAQKVILRFHGLSEEFHHFDLSFVTWGVRSDRFLMAASGAAFKHGVTRFILSVSVPGADVVAAPGFDEHNRQTLKADE